MKPKQPSSVLYLLFLAWFVWVGVACAGEIHDAARAGDMEKVKALLKVNPGLVNAKAGYLMDTPLFSAVGSGHKDVVELLLSKGAEVNAKNRDGWTPLHEAASSGQKDVVELLLSKGAEVNAKVKDGRTPLHEAAYADRKKEVVELLLSKGAEVNAKDDEGRTPLSNGIDFYARDVVRILLQHGAKDEIGGTGQPPREIHEAATLGDLDKIKKLLDENPGLANAKDRKGSTPLHWASSKVVAKLLIAGKADVNAKDKDGWTPLHKAANKDVAELLLNRGADVNAKDGYWMYTPLFEAAWSGKKDYVELLLAKGAEVNAKARFGETPLFKAAWSGKDVVELLLNKGAEVNAKDNNGETPLFNAASSDHKDVVELLLAKGAEVKARSKGGKTPLFNAASSGRKNVVELLLNKGAEVTAKDEDGTTPLFNAASYGHKDVVELLLSKGAEVNAKDEDGKTPLHKAAFYGRKDVASLLLSKGAEVTAKDKHGRTPLGEAMEEGCKEVVELLQSKGAKFTAEDKEEPLNLVTAGQQLHQGRDYEAAGQMDKAEAVYLRVLKWYEDHGSPAIIPLGQDICYRLAELYQKRGDLAQAVDYCQRLIERALAWEEAWKKDGWDRTDREYEALLYLLLGQTCRLDGQYARAIKADLKSVELNPKESVAYKELGLAYFYDGQEAKAAEAFKHALALKTDDINTLGWLAYVKLQMGMMADALEVARKGMEADPTKPLAWTQAGTSLVRLARYDEAIKLLLEANKRFPKNADIAWWLGKAYQGKGEGGGVAGANVGGTAVKWFREASRLGVASHEEVLKKLEDEGQKAEKAGNSYRALQKYTEAFSHFPYYQIRHPLRDTVIRLYNKLPAKPVLPPQAIAFGQRGEAALKAGDYDTAIDAYFDAVGVAPWWADGYFNLAIAYHVLFQFGMDESRGAAIECLNYYLALQPAKRDADAAKALIEKWSQERKKGN